eukprot:8826444-Pyramimonas_sp.AAC.1
MFHRSTKRLEHSRRVVGGANGVVRLKGKDPREAWTKTMIDMYMLSLCDQILVTFESSYNNAALARSFGQ